MSSRTSSIRRDKKTNNLNNKLPFILGPYDSWLFNIIIILTIVGVICVFTASGPDAVRIYNDPFYFFKKQAIFDIGGIILMIVLSRIDYNVWRKVALPFAIVVIGLIAATYVVGVEAFGGERWLRFGPLTLQPSEFGKLAAILLAAEALAFCKTIVDKKFILNMVIIAVMVILILKQPSLSIAMIISASTVIVLFMGGFPLHILFPIMIVGSLGVIHTVKNTPYQMNRILGWLNPWADPQNKGYNIIQSWYAFGSGGLFGVGFGNSKQKLFYLPFRHTDFIFAVIAEEFGLIGAFMIVVLFVAFAYRGLVVSMMAETTFAKLLAVGITASITLQAFINMGVASGVLPPTGVTLPLISYGGSSTLATFFMLGILLNISRKRIQRINNVHSTAETA
jgi:cell division protein FtsW